MMCFGEPGTVIQVARDVVIDPSEDDAQILALRG